MTLTTFQKLLSELLAQYNEEAENHSIREINLMPIILDTGIVADYDIEIKTTGK